MMAVIHVHVHSDYESLEKPKAADNLSVKLVEVQSTPTALLQVPPNRKQGRTIGVSSYYHR